MSTTVYAGLFCLALASFVLLWSVGALGLTLHALLAPKATRKTLSDHVTRIRRRWFERKLPKPKMPHDCTLCAAQHETLASRAVPPPYATRKSRRGRRKHRSTQGLACLNPDCLYFGCTDAAVHALVADGWAGQQHDIQRFRYQACYHVFSSRRNTPRFRLQKPLLLVQSVFLLLALGLSRADVARVLGIDDDSVARWLDRFGAHGDHLHETLLRGLTPEVVQLDEIRAELRSTPRVRWLWLAIDPTTKLVLSYLLASRKTPDAMPFMHRLCDRLAPGHLPVFLSDGLRQYHALLTAHFGTWVEGKWVVSLHLHLAQIVKILRARRLIATFPRALCGSLRHVRQQLRELSFTGIIQTAFIERLNLSIRHGVGALHRRTWATCRRQDRLQSHVAVYLSFYHFVRPHSGLCQGKLNRTPAMAAGLTDHCWSVEEWLTRPVYL